MVAVRFHPPVLMTLHAVTPCGGGAGFPLAVQQEGGTPDIVASIRCGMVFQLKQAVGEDTIHRLETELVNSALIALRSNPNLVP